MRRALFAATVACLLVGGAWAAAQQAQFPYGGPVAPPDIRTGADLGFRIRGMKDGRAMGVLVVRTRNGDWVEAHHDPTRGFVVPLDTK